MNEVIKKLRIKEGNTVLILNMPSELTSVFSPVDPAFKPSSKKNSFDQVICFCSHSSDVLKFAVKASEQVVYDGMLWVCYPKGTSKIKTDINRDKGWAPLTEKGFTGIALVSVDDTWSAMRFRPSEMVGK